MLELALAMQAAGLHRVSLHSLRHSCGSRLLSDDAPITAVAERIGHASPNIALSIHSHALPADNQAAAKQWNDATMPDVIQESRKQAQRKRMLANVSAEDQEKKIILIKFSELANRAGLEPDDIWFTRFHSMRSGLF